MTDRNKNRPGYRKTKIGWIPEEWSTATFGSLATTSKSKYTPTDSDNRKCIELEHIGQDSGRVNGYCNSGNQSSQKTVFREGNVLFGKLRPYLRKAALCKFAGVCSTEIWVLKNSTKITPSYLSYLVLTDRFISEADKTSGTKMPRADWSHVESVLHPRPPRPEQNKIAEVLSCWDESIQTLEELITEKSLRKKGLMQQLLTGKKRLPQFLNAKNAGRLKHRFFDIPPDWKLVKIREVAAERGERNKSGEPMTVLSCSKRKGFIESSQYFGKQVHSDDTSNYKIIEKGWFGFPSNHIEEGSIGLLTSHENGIVSPIYTVFKTNKEAHPEYYFSLFKTEIYRHIFQITTNGSVNRRGSLRWKEFRQIQVPLPSLQEQKAIAEVLQTADEEIRTLEEQLKDLHEQKKGLMQKLLTGEVRHPDFRKAG